jgi:acetyltransferase
VATSDVPATLGRAPGARLDPDAVRRAVLCAVETVAPGTDIRCLRSDRPLRGQIDLDSLDCINLISSLEQRLAIAIPDADEGRLETVDAIVAYLVSNQGRTAGASPDAATDAAAGRLPAHHCIHGVDVTVRPMCSDDMSLEAEFVGHLSPTSRYRRFLGAVRELPQAKLESLTHVDQKRHVALAATVERDGREVLIGAVRYVADAAGTGCEFAAVIDDAWQGSGLAGIQMRALMAIARAHGLKTMEGIVLASNRTMVRFARQLGFIVDREPDDPGLVRVRRNL